MMTDEYIKREVAMTATEKPRVIPAEDVAPVAKGEWIRRYDSIFARCPDCGCEVMQLKSVVFCGKGRIDFCPNCGADLREES